jgi:hypothetical protein
VRILAPGVPVGTHAASAYPSYDDGHRTAHWTGTIAIPPAQPQPVSIGPGTRVVKIPGSTPGWLWPLVGLLARGSCGRRRVVAVRLVAAEAQGEHERCSAQRSQDVTS